MKAGSNSIDYIWRMVSSKTLSWFPLKVGVVFGGLAFIRFLPFKPMVSVLLINIH
jgi:hypothetical protein